MTYVLTDLVWLFFIYSFAGWCVEVCFAAFSRRKFVNRGFVNSPYCTIYGFSAVLFAVFLPELVGSLFFLFLGGLLLASIVEPDTYKSPLSSLCRQRASTHPETAAYIRRCHTIPR